MTASFALFGWWGYANASRHLSSDPFPLFYFLIATNVLLARSCLLSGPNRRQWFLTGALFGLSIVLYACAQTMSTHFVQHPTPEGLLLFECSTGSYFAFVLAWTSFAPVVPKPKRSSMQATTTASIVLGAFLLFLSSRDLSALQHLDATNQVRVLGHWILMVALVLYCFLIIKILVLEAGSEFGKRNGDL